MQRLMNAFRDRADMLARLPLMSDISTRGTIFFLANWRSRPREHLEMPA
jgi:hypothetical protein